MALRVDGPCRIAQSTGHGPARFSLVFFGFRAVVAFPLIVRDLLIEDLRCGCV